MFGWVLRQLARAGLLRGEMMGIDATTPEANAGDKIDCAVRRAGGSLANFCLAF